MTPADGPLRLLVVCQAVAAADLMRTSLEAATSQLPNVRHMTDLDAALAYVGDTPPDALVLELGQPPTAGIDAVRAVRAHHPGLPIVVLADHFDKDVGTDVLHAGAQDLLCTDSLNPQGVLRALTHAIERQQLIASLKSSELSFRVLIERNPDPIIVTNAEGVVLFVNPAAEDFFGPTREHLGFALGLCGSEGEFAVTRSDGTACVAEPRCTPIEWEGQAANIIVLRDVTERKQMEEDLREREARFRELAENIRDVFWIWDVDLARFVYLSPTFERVWGQPASAVYDESFDWFETIHPDDRQPLKNAVAQHGAGGTFSQQHRIIRPDGSTRWVQARGFPVRDETGRAHRITGLTEDITDRIHLEGQLRQAQKLEAVGQLAAGIAHEINTPTQFVGDNTQFLQQTWDDLRPLLEFVSAIPAELRREGVAEPLAAQLTTLLETADLDYLRDEVPQAIAQAFDGVSRIAKIVRAMKEFSHPGEDSKTALHLNDAITTTMTVARNEWKYIAEVQTDFDPELPPVTCLAGEINQVLLNLLVNAAHAIAAVTPGQPEAKGTITITTRVDGDWVEVRVRDSGPGVPKEIRDRIFEPFFTTKEVGKGTGQGLALAHNVIVSKHGGQLWCESPPGEGATFVVRLPIGEPTGSEVAA